MKTPVEIWFDKFLEFMEPAWKELGRNDFVKLENKIIDEITHRRMYESPRTKKKI